MQNQEIKLHLDIDQEQDEGTAYWYPFVPPTTDMMYLMPQIGTNSSLYIPGQQEQNAIITGSVRTNGGGCEKTGDPNTRYLGTEYGQELKLAPGGIYITAGKSNLVANFDDEEGVKLSSHKKLILEAEQEIIIESQKTVSISAASQILIATPSAAISMENETHFLAAQTHITCTDEAPFPDVEQPEQEEEEQQQQVNPAREKGEEKSGVNWPALAVGAIAAVGLCIAAAPIVMGAVAVAGLTGLAATVVTSAVSFAIGAAGATIGYMSTDDLMNGRTADLGEYVKRAAQAGVVGLITGAIFGPLLAGATGLAFVGLSGGASAYSSWLNDMLFNGGKIDYENLELATALGIFCGVVAKPVRVSATEGPENARYGERKISDETYNKLRKKTPNEEARDNVNKDIEFPISDPALPGKIANKFEADHIVPMDKITRMDGFEQLTQEQQLKVLNNPENFTGLSKTANTSKGSKSYEEWTTYKKENITVDPTFRERMIRKSSEMEGKIQKQIDDLNGE